MNAADRKEFELIHEKIDNIKSDLSELKDDIAMAHDKTNVDLKFIKENMFNPHEGLWAETKLNTQYREDSKKWRYPIGVGLICLIIKNIWDTMTS